MCSPPFVEGFYDRFWIFGGVPFCLDVSIQATKTIKKGNKRTRGSWQICGSPWHSLSISCCTFFFSFTSFSCCVFTPAQVDPEAAGLKPIKEPSRQRLQQQFSRALDRWWDNANAGEAASSMPCLYYYITLVWLLCSTHVALVQHSCGSCVAHGSAPFTRGNLLAPCLACIA